MTRQKRMTRGVVTLAASGLIAGLIYFGLANPYPALRPAYLICAAAGVWGLIDIVWALFSNSAEQGDRRGH